MEFTRSLTAVFLCFSLAASQAATEKTPHPMTSVRSAADFVQSQRGLNGRGLPATFYVPPGTPLPDFDNRLLVTEGVGLYDTALAIMVLTEAGRLNDVRALLDIYTSGLYGTDALDPMELRAYPNYSNGRAFKPFDSSTSFFFDFTNVHGCWSRWKDRWRFWSVHTGPNAWLLNATTRFIDLSRRRGVPEVSLRRYVDLAESLGQAILMLQDAKTLGGVRYAPQGVYHAEDAPDPYEEINTENNISCYAALMALFRVTNDPIYRKGAHRILVFLKEAPVWDQEGRAHRGLYDRNAGTLAMGVFYRNGHWVLETDHPTDSGGTWAISALGPEKIDAWFGTFSAYRMWRAIRRQAGRTMDYRYAEDDGPLAGLDYNDSFPPNESLISPEWTAGGLYALRQLNHYYRQPAHHLNAHDLAGLRRDERDMGSFIRHNPSAYALGPGHAGTRRGQTGFGWSSPPQAVTAMASTYFALYAGHCADPIAWWRTDSSSH
jgi:hypothetical protein